MAAQRRAFFVVPIFILGCALGGGLFGSAAIAEFNRPAWQSDRT